PTLSDRQAYELCALCNWEDDGQDDPHADEVWGGPNKDYSLTEARTNFRKDLIMFRPGGDPRIGGEDSELAKAAKRNIVGAFDELDGSAHRRSADDVWATIRANEKILREETA